MYKRLVNIQVWDHLRHNVYPVLKQYPLVRGKRKAKRKGCVSVQNRATQTRCYDAIGHNVEMTICTSLRIWSVYKHTRHCTWPSIPTPKKKEKKERKIEIEWGKSGTLNVVRNQHLQSLCKSLREKVRGQPPENIIMNFFCPLLHHQWVKPHAANCPRLRRIW